MMTGGNTAVKVSDRKESESLAACLCRSCRASDAGNDLRFGNICACLVRFDGSYRCAMHGYYVVVSERAAGRHRLRVACLCGGTGGVLLLC